MLSKSRNLFKLFMNDVGLLACQYAGGIQLDLFDTRPADDPRERKRQEAILAIRKKYGKNAILKGMDFEEGATARERNQQIGGHRE